jgi:hypothetical protein
MVLDIQTVHHILKNTAVQNVNKPFVYITDLTSTLNIDQIKRVEMVHRPGFSICRATHEIYTNITGLYTLEKNYI